MPSKKTKAALTKSDKTPTSVGTDLEVQLQDQKSTSVCDYLYTDVIRVSSFLAQFEEYGLLQSVVANEEEERSEEQKVKIGFGVKAAVIGGDAGEENTTGTRQKDSAERTYDSVLTHARRLLDFLRQNNLIQSSLVDAGIGQFILVTGRLGVADLSTISSLLSIDSLRSVSVAVAIKSWQEEAKNPNHVKTKEQSSLETSMPDPKKRASVLIDIIRGVPLGLQARMLVDDKVLYCNLKKDAIISSSNELQLSNGILVPGSWTMLGVMDSHPDDENSEETARVENLLFGDLSEIVKSYSAAMRGFGRPKTSFGVTPLLIYRETKIIEDAG